MENKSRVKKSNQNLFKDKYNIRAPNYNLSRKTPRWISLDVARGFAIILMILSHCVKGLMIHSKIPDWGNVPVHALTKFSSILFILVFGLSISLYFMPYIKTNDWTRKRIWMIKRGIELMFWYKILTVVQMFQFYPKKMIINTLLFKRMPDFVEILCFYSIALLWLPFFLPLWSRLSPISKMAVIFGTFFTGQWLHYNFDFWDIDTLQAILVEKEGFYTFGQFQRGAIIFLGIFIGDLYKETKDRQFSKFVIPLGCSFAGITSLSYFYFSNIQSFHTRLEEVSGNIGKHPFGLNFLSFSIGGALLILGISLLMNQTILRLMKPISYIGKHSLTAFILHIFVIFYLYRYYFKFYHKVTYEEALQLTGLCVVGIIFVIYLWNKAKAVFS